MKQFNLEVNGKYVDLNFPREVINNWSATAKKLHAEFWNIESLQRYEISKSVISKADYEYLYDFWTSSRLFIPDPCWYI